MKQLDLLDQIAADPAPHNGTPESVLAAAGLRGAKVVADMRAILVCLRDNPDITDDDIQYITGIKPSSERPRRGRLVDCGMVAKSGRGKSALGNAASLWALTDKGLAVVGSDAGTEEDE